MNQNEDRTVPEHEAGFWCRQMNLDNKVEGGRGQGYVKARAVYVKWKSRWLWLNLWPGQHSSQGGISETPTRANIEGCHPSSSAR